METIASLWIWVGFIVFVLAMLALYLGVFHRKSHVVSFRESIAWPAVATRPHCSVESVRPRNT